MIWIQLWILDGIDSYIYNKANQEKTIIRPIEMYNYYYCHYYYEAHFPKPYSMRKIMIVG